MSNTTVHRRSRSIVEIIDAVERSKSQWQSQSSPSLIRDNLASNNEVISTQKRRSDSRSYDDKDCLITLPQAPPASATRQEHHRYFYALRKATRQRKQQATISTSAQTSMQCTEPSSISTVAVTYEPQTRPRSPSSSSSLSPTACRAPSTISTSSISTLTHESGHANAPKTSYAAVLAAWQRTPDDSIFIHAVNDKRTYEEIRCLSDLLIDDDRKEIERIFDELTASLYMQHAELLTNDF